MIEVSVIIPVYNVEKYLRQCLDSVISQTLRDIEIICVDDGSTDSSPQILADYAARDHRVRIVQQQNGGAGAARNNGMSFASGKYLSFLDSDDFFEPDMLEKAYWAAEMDSADFVVFKSDRYITAENSFEPMAWAVRESALPPYHPISYRQMTDNVFKVFVGWAWDKLYSHTFVEQYGFRFQEQRTTNDMLFVFSALVMAKRITVLSNVLAHQRRDAADSLSKTRENSWWCFHDALIALRDYLRENDKFPELEQDFINYTLHATLWNYNSLLEPTKSMLLEKMKESWAEEFGLKGKDGSYFYEKGEYHQGKELFL